MQDCLSLRDARPVEWLQRHFEVDARWTLVHATHLSAEETRQLAASGATVAICPTTEANLGDGLFPLRDYLDAGGAWGIGSDSHISVSPVEELRWLEYGQRLVTRHRNIAVGAGSSSVGETLLHGVLASARAATGQDRTGDTLVLNANAPILAGASDGDVVDRWIFSGNHNVVDSVHVGGTQVVSGGRHRDHERIARQYRATLTELLAE